MFDWVKARKKKAEATVHGRSLDELFRIQRGPLIRFVMAKIKNEAEAEEIVQEAFIRFQNKYDPVETASPEALLARIASNLLIDRVRERDARAAREDAWGKLHTAGADEFSPVASVDPARALDAKQRLEAVMALLDTWPEKTRQVFLLHRFEGLSHAEIVARTGIPKSTVEKHMIRAIKALACLRDEE
ncbi:MAG: RNA polymerase sigma factor [Alphaproteobacteria bacterium]|nr:RNA polymerase sigma factor [Alphaproteobacteria bacterium]